MAKIRSNKYNMVTIAIFIVVGSAATTLHFISIGHHNIYPAPRPNNCIYKPIMLFESLNLQFNLIMKIPFSLFWLMAAPCRVSSEVN